MKLRFRTLLIAGGTSALLAALVVTTPRGDGDWSWLMLLFALVMPFVAVGFAHLARKGLHDYPEADMQRLFAKAGEEPTGAGLALVALAIIVAALLGLFSPRARAEGMQPPAQALPLLPLLRGEIQAAWPDHPMPHYFGGLIEHESACPRVRSCWKPTAQLKSAREEGAGLGQLTRAYRSDGSLRFDALAEMRAAHPALRELDWASIYQRPDLQLRAVVLKSRGDWRAMPSVPARLEFTDLAYNAGRLRVELDRRACVLKSVCDPEQWWGHVEHTCTASRQPLYGTRSACDISRRHVVDVIRHRAPKYVGAF